MSELVEATHKPTMDQRNIHRDFFFFFFFFKKIIINLEMDPHGIHAHFNRHIKR